MCPNLARVVAAAVAVLLLAEVRLSCAQQIRRTVRARQHDSEHEPIHTSGATTRPGVPALFQEALRARAQIDESAHDSYGAEAAVNALEAAVGWDALKSAFVHPEVLATAVPGEKALTSAVGRDAREQAAQMVDIVMPSIRDLDVFLEAWRPFIEPFHLILVQDGDPDKNLHIPEWADYELYNRRDIERALGADAWIISQRDASIRNFGFLVAEKQYVYTIDDDCLPTTMSGEQGGVADAVDAIAGHLENLRSPATPYFFNTVHDPYREGADFVRGFPYSMRSGVRTAISHGLWTNAFDYDAPTQLLKVHERNTRYVDAVDTVPHGVLYPMCSMNVAFDRELIGPAFMQGLMGDGQPWARYDDMFAGWASKVVADHIGVGVKSGAPYIRHDKASNPFTNLKKEYKGLFWQETCISFFQTVKLSEASKSDSGTAYLELAGLVRQNLAELDVEYFERLATAMEKWVHVWRKRQLHEIPLLASRASSAPSSPKSRASCAVFTVTRHDNFFLPLWLEYYGKHVAPDDLWVLDHSTEDGSANFLHTQVGPRKARIKRLVGETSLLNRVVEAQMRLLLRSGYPCVVFSKTDEFFVADPQRYPGGLGEYLEQFAQNETLYLRPEGRELIEVSEDTKPLDWTTNIFAQRTKWRRNHALSKPCIVKKALKYSRGLTHAKTFRGETPIIPLDTNLKLIRIKAADKERCIRSERAKHKEEAWRNVAHPDHSEGFDARIQRGEVCAGGGGGGNPGPPEPIPARFRAGWSDS